MKIRQRRPYNLGITMAFIWLLPLMTYILRKVADPDSIKREEIYFYTIPAFFLLWFFISFKFVKSNNE